jgi:NADH-quinone oxidoreductase subunit L
VRDHLEDPAPVVMNPLYVLAFFSVIAGYVGLPQVWGDAFGIPESNSLANFLAPAVAAGEPHHLAHSTEYMMAAGAVGLAGVGALLAWYLYVRRPELPGKLAASLAVLYRLLLNKYYVDEVYDALIVRPTVKLSDRVLFRLIDAGLIDSVIVDGSARTVWTVADGVLKRVQTGFTQSYLFLMIVGAVAIVGYLLR